MKKPVLVIMAAGMGSRYGGLKQIDPIDYDGHIIIDFSIYDAVRAGFEKVIFIIKRENEQIFRETIGKRAEGLMEVAYVFQELENIPDGFTVPEGRIKPWGTGHAVLSCIDILDGPFAVINADDYYGPEAFKMIYDYLTTHEDDSRYRYTMVGYRLGNTLTENGHVSRGVCTVDFQGAAGDALGRSRPGGDREFRRRAGRRAVIIRRVANVEDLSGVASQGTSVGNLRAGEVHRPVIHDTTPYERMIIYVSPDFAVTSSDKTIFLNQCFLPDAAMPSNVLHLSGMKERRLLDTMTELVHSFSEDSFANEIYQNTLFLEFMIHLNRAALSGTLQYEDSFQANEKILSVLTYMNEHLTEDITVDSLAEHFFTSRYYLMHSFKEQTGYTIGNYLSTKRLLFARDLISSGTAVTDACFACGFHNYSTFLRAYKKQFGKSPREMI